MLYITDTIATTLKHLDLVVQSHDKATGMSSMKIIGDLLHVLVQCGQERVKTLQPTFPDQFYPTLDLSLGPTLDDIGRCQGRCRLFLCSFICVFDLLLFRRLIRI